MTTHNPLSSYSRKKVLVWTELYLSSFKKRLKYATRPLVPLHATDLARCKALYCRIGRAENYRFYPYVVFRHIFLFGTPQSAMSEFLFAELLLGLVFLIAWLYYFLDIGLGSLEK